jgi:hypothetical protein
VIDEPGSSPRSPNIVVGPVLVTVEPASTEKLAADPRPTGGLAASAFPASSRLSDATDTSPAPTLFMLGRVGRECAGGRRRFRRRASPRECWFEVIAARCLDCEQHPQPNVAFGSPADSIESRDFANPPHDGGAVYRAMLTLCFAPGRTPDRELSVRHKALEVIRTLMRDQWRATSAKRRMSSGLDARIAAHQLDVVAQSERSRRIAMSAVPMSSLGRLADNGVMRLLRRPTADTTFS